MNKIKFFLYLILSIFILFYLITTTYSFSKIYFSFKQENHLNLQNFIDKNKISASFRKQLNTIIYEKIEKETLLKIIYSLDKESFDILISANINKLSDHLSDEKTLISLYKNPSLIKDHDYDKMLKKYLQEIVQLNNYDSKIIDCR